MNLDLDKLFLDEDDETNTRFSIKQCSLPAENTETQTMRNDRQRVKIWPKTYFKAQLFEWKKLDPKNKAGVWFEQSHLSLHIPLLSSIREAYPK